MKIRGLVKLKRLVKVIEKRFEIYILCMLLFFGLSLMIFGINNIIISEIGAIVFSLSIVESVIEVTRRKSNSLKLSSEKYGLKLMEM